MTQSVDHSTKWSTPRQARSCRCVCYPNLVRPPTFTQPERRSFTLPIILAVGVLASGLFALHRTTQTSLTAKHLHTDVLPNTTIYKADTIVLGPPVTTYTLFVVSKLSIDNHRSQPISLDDMVLTLTDSKGAQLSAQALRPQELANAELSFPKLKPLMTTPLLLREAPIAANQVAEGTAVFSVAVPQSIWDKRTSATIALTPYHLDPIILTLPQ